MFPVWEIGAFLSNLSIVADFCEFKVTIFLIVSIAISDRPYCLFVFLAECLVLDQSAVCYLPLHEDLSVIEGDEWFRGLNGQEHVTCKFLSKEDLRSTLSSGLWSSNPQVLSVIL